MNDIQVHTTKDYSLFKTLNGNRDVNHLHLSRLKESMSKNHLTTIIMVNENFEIIALILFVFFTYLFFCCRLFSFNYLLKYSGYLISNHSLSHRLLSVKYCVVNFGSLFILFS